MESEGIPKPKATEVTASAYRYSDYDTPFWASSNTQPSRWHRVGDGPTQYLSLSPDGAWAELIRRENLQTEAEIAMIRKPMWEARIATGNIANYGEFAIAQDAGFPPEALVDDDHEACQDEGRRLRALGFVGVIAPSAALPGEKVLVLFGARRMIGWNDDPRLASAVPARNLGIGSPTVGLVDRVRFYGNEHIELAKYLEAPSDS